MLWNQYAFVRSVGRKIISKSYKNIFKSYKLGKRETLKNYADKNLSLMQHPYKLTMMRIMKMVQKLMVDKMLRTSKRKIQSLIKLTLGEINLKYVEIRFAICFPVYIKNMRKSQKSRKKRSFSNYNKPLEIIESAKNANNRNAMIHLFH